MCHIQTFIKPPNSIQIFNGIGFAIVKDNTKHKWNIFMMIYLLIYLYITKIIDQVPFLSNITIYFIATLDKKISIDPSQKYV